METTLIGEVCVGDVAFPLRINLLKPFGHRNLSTEEKVFNYRLSRARRVVENAFGILASGFRILLQPIDLKVDTIELLVKAACAIHNWLRITSANYLPSGSTDEEDVNNGNINPGAWRKELLHPLQSVSVGYFSNNYIVSAEKLRRSYARAFTTNLSVPWQLQGLYL